MELLARRDDGSTFKAMVEFAHATFEGEACLQIVFRQQTVDPALVAQLQRDPVTGLFNRAHTLECIDEAVAAAAAGRAGQAVVLLEPDNWKDLVASAGIGNADHLLAAIAAKVNESIDDDDIAGVLGDHTLGLVLSPRGAWNTRRSPSVCAPPSPKPSSTRAPALSPLPSPSAARCSPRRTPTRKRCSIRPAPRCVRHRIKAETASNCTIRRRAKRPTPNASSTGWIWSVRRSRKTACGFTTSRSSACRTPPASSTDPCPHARAKGDVLPSYFFPVAERNGLLPAIDRWVLGHAIDALAHRENDGLTTTYFVKMTLQSLEDPELLPWLIRRLQTANLRRSKLVIEMPESKVLTSLRPTQEFVTGWRKAGGGFAIEQFGSGLNSFRC